MRIAVTGAAGMIGGAVARRLGGEGHDVVAFDQRRPDVELPARFVVCDGRDRATIERELRGVECVCHLGEVPNVTNRFGLSPEQVRETNVAICRAVLDASIAVGVRRFIYTSSCQVYGYWGGAVPTDHLPAVWPLDERQPVSPRNPYAESKVLNEQACERASRETAIETIRFRFPWVLGPQQAGAAASRYRKADEELYEGFWSYLDLRDAVEAYVSALPVERTYPVEEGRSTAFHFVARRAWGDEPIASRLRRFVGHFPALPAHWSPNAPPVSCAKAERYLSWEPRFHFDAQGNSVRQQTGG